MKQNIFRFAATLLLLVSTTGQVLAQAPAPATGIRILVYGIHYGGNLVYNYKVINNGDAPFNNFTIGGFFDIAEDYEYPQLTRLPLGWKYGREGETGTAIILDPASTRQPAYWTAHVFCQQDAGDNYYLNWYSTRGPGDVSNAIRPGQTLAGFSVTIPLEDSNLSLPAVTGQPVFTGPDEKYVKGNFKVGLFRGDTHQEVWGTLEREDTTPPTLTVTLSPNVLRTTEKMVPITATITVKDDLDPAPAVVLESIMVNEPFDKDDAKGAEPGTDDRQFMLKADRHLKAGRIYTVTYSATDGTGNKTTASATVTVPHDQSDKERDDKGKGDGKKDERKDGKSDKGDGKNSENKPAWKFW
ncbi:MAG: hypothetical protein PHQ60_02795 [Sideroxydans sp.]|nr:hypothetical protein [Sideroxydans sp.]